jgi:hypothetical protein
VPVLQRADGGVQAVIMMVFGFEPVKAFSVNEQSQDGGQFGGFGRAYFLVFQGDLLAFDKEDKFIVSFLN